MRFLGDPDIYDATAIALPLLSQGTIVFVADLAHLVFVRGARTGIAE
mgnify:CR=1 FL=1